MSWNVIREFACPKCGSKYKKEVGTFTFARKDYWKCSKCGSDIKPLNNQKENNKFIEKLKGAYSED
ncbi:hypothetical protein CT694_07850 [Bacillus wiedmannii bv. thuringiensis]|nr:hypothetical protein CT694_07850 [Bacillus wiedmannii bv. thuringiensis]